MEQNYIFSEQIFNDWVKDLEVACLENSYPSQQVLDTIIDYSMTEEIFSKTLNANIFICLN